MLLSPDTRRKTGPDRFSRASVSRISAAGPPCASEDTSLFHAGPNRSMRSNYSNRSVFNADVEATRMSRQPRQFMGPPIAPTSPRKSPRKSPQKRAADRFLPSRMGGATNTGDANLAEACGLRLGGRMLEYAPPAPPAALPADLRSQFLLQRPSSTEGLRAQKDVQRKVSKVPETILDAPGIVDDYYLSLLDWSKSNCVAIALANCVYVWSADTGSVTCAAELPDTQYVASVKWSDEGYLALGTNTGEVQIWDVEQSTKLRTMLGRCARVSTMSWNDAILTSGCRDGSIWNHDVRIADHKTAELLNHTGEVCGLAWRPDGAQLASGGNDNVVNVWDARVTRAPRHHKTQHTAAVKALAWCPWQTNVLATGGGSLDRHIHVWNTTTGVRTSSLDTGSQVSSLAWNTHHRELAACLGYPGNSIALMSYPSLARVATVDGAHESRILHAALSPDGRTLATCAADENLKFWTMFDAPTVQKTHTLTSSFALR